MERTDTVVQTAVNRKVLAKAALYFQQNGERPRSMSEMLRTIVSIFDTIITKHGAEDIATSEEATEILQSMFKVELNPGDRYLKSFLKNLEDQNGRVETDEIKFSSIPKPVGRPGKWDENDQKRMNAAYEKAIVSPRILAILEQNRKATSSPQE